MSQTLKAEDLVGVWRRRSIELEDGQIDTTTQVFWLQTQACFGDIRIPLERPELPLHRDLADLTESGALALAHQQGFAGMTHLEGNTCHWQRYLDYQPPNGSRDIGLLQLEQDCLVELGVEQVYREEWERIDDGSTGCIALVLDPDEPSGMGERWQGCFVAVGNYFVYVLDQRPALPAANSMLELLQSAQNRTEQLRYLNCEISFGRCNLGRSLWEIERSTLPWREGQSLWNPSDLSVDLDRQQVMQTVTDAIVPQVRTWRILEWGNDFKHAQLESAHF
ncbi:MAG TPA: hypothetical protein V6D19_01590 [Stenomitos sp.]